jgi:hypothetical protein
MPLETRPADEVTNILYTDLDVFYPETFPRSRQQPARACTPDDTQLLDVAPIWGWVQQRTSPWVRYPPLGKHTHPCFMLNNIAGNTDTAAADPGPFARKHDTIDSRYSTQDHHHTQWWPPNARSPSLCACPGAADHLRRLLGHLCEVWCAIEPTATVQTHAKHADQTRHQSVFFPNAGSR